MGGDDEVSEEVGVGIGQGWGGDTGPAGAGKEEEELAEGGVLVKLKEEVAEAWGGTPVAEGVEITDGCAGAGAPAAARHETSL
ncbi:MAG: hypothetical protein HYX80_09935 [Chloroflexi bacterium]|nr:hypothetical protein [Chloroflexota bacterium]